MAVYIRTGIRTREACDLAGIETVRFNEMVNAGHFPCAPKTRRGAVRLFTLDRTIALKIFGHLLSLSLAPQRAGEVACAAYHLFENRDDLDRLFYNCDATGEWTMEVGSPCTEAKTQPEIRLELNIGMFREQLREAQDWNETIISRVKGDAS